MYDDVEEVELTLEDCNVNCRCCNTTIRQTFIVCDDGEFCSYRCLAEHQVSKSEYLYGL